MEEIKDNSKFISLGVLVAVVLLVLAVGAIDKRNKKISAVPVTVSSVAPANNTTSVATTAGAYRAGSYSAVGTYQDPNQGETIKISVTISTDGTITDTSANNEAKSVESKSYQDRFIRNYKSRVVGKSIASLKLGNVSGSSLTPIGFNNAIAAIARQAAS